MRETLLYPLEAIRLHEVLARYSDWLYFTLVLIFFISLAGLALRRHFERPYVKPLIVAVGLLLTIAVFKNRSVLEAIFSGWGVPWALSCWSAWPPSSPWAWQRALACPAARRPG